MQKKLNFKKLSIHEGPKQSPGFLLWHVSTFWRSSIESVLKALGLTHPQFVMLATIGWLTRDNDLITQVAIGNMAGLDPNTTSQVIKGLEQRCLVKRVQSSDGRAKNVSLTGTGAELLSQALPAVEKADDKFFNGLSKGDMASLLIQFQKLIQKGRIKTDEGFGFEADGPFVRPLIEGDIQKIVSRYSFPWSSREKTQSVWEAYFQEHLEGIRTVAVIEETDEILGYGSLLRRPECSFFAEKNIPEINAIWIDEDHRKRGLGTALIQWLEAVASHEGHREIGIGVGLYKDYGPAQRLYFKLGYSPVGNGITYKGEASAPGRTYPLDDELILWLSKAL